MTYFISIALPIILLLFAVWFMRLNYRAYFINWRKELTFQKVLKYGLPIIIKSSILYFLIIVIHNYVHSEHRLELVLFILLFFVLSITQSAYSIGGFVSRIKFIFNYSVKQFNKKSEEADKFIARLFHDSFSKYTFFVKVVITASFLVFFLPNIGLFIASNIYFFLIIISFLLLSFMLNNIIYFGLISLMIFQYDPVSISFVNVNVIVVILSYLVLVAGFVIETRFDNRMFLIVGSRLIKKMNFGTKYYKMLQTRHHVVYQNTLNKNYYVYYRLNGIVLIFESYYDAKLSIFIVKKMIQKGIQYLDIYDI
jgi:hypothetical protein